MKSSIKIVLCCLALLAFCLFVSAARDESGARSRRARSTASGQKSGKVSVSGKSTSSKTKSSPIIQKIISIASKTPSKKLVKMTTQSTRAAKPAKKRQDVIAAMEKNLMATVQPSSTGFCARHVADAIDAALGNKFARAGSAKNFGPYLEKNGFKVVYDDIQAGDVQIFQGGFTYNGKSYPDGHMQMKTSKGKYVSDFIQTDMYAGPGYRAKKQQPTNYRYGG